MIDRAALAAILVLVFAISGADPVAAARQNTIRVTQVLTCPSTASATVIGTIGSEQSPFTYTCSPNRPRDRGTIRVTSDSSLIFWSVELTTQTTRGETATCPLQGTSLPMLMHCWGANPADDVTFAMQ